MSSPTSDSQTVEDQNIRIVKASIDAFNAHDVNRTIEYQSESVVEYSPDHPKGSRGRDPIITEMTADFVALPDARLNVDQIIGSGDWVVVRGLLTGTNTGPMMTRKGRRIKASKRPISVPQAFFHKVQSGKIVETRVYWDRRSLLAQLGFLRKSMFTAFAFIFVGLAFMIAYETVPFYLVVGQVTGLALGAFSILFGAFEIGRVVLELSRINT